MEGSRRRILGDLVSLEYSKALSKAAAASKVVFLVSPSSTTKPQSLANLLGAIIQGRAEDVLSSRWQDSGL